VSGPALIAGQAARSPAARKAALAALALLAGALCTPLLALVATGSSTRAYPSVTADIDVPARYLAAYERAASSAGIDWAIVAAIGKVECNHGRSRLRGCSPVGSVNSAGAAGPMQFLATTWRAGAPVGISPAFGPPTTSATLGYAADGDRDGIADVWNIDDAALAAARLLAANGAPLDYSRALYAYNHSSLYVARVLRVASAYRAGDIGVTPTSGPGAWAMTYLGSAYVWGGNHAPPERQLGLAQPTQALARDGRIGFFDCSSLVSWAYAKARGLWVGGTTGEQWQLAGQAPGALRGYGAPPGGWQAGDIGFYDSLNHVVLALNATTYVEAPQTGADVRTGLFSARGEPYGFARYPTPRPPNERQH
jgi:cell wall-associated NlpC family hydrolase